MLGAFFVPKEIAIAFIELLNLKQKYYNIKMIQLFVVLLS